MTTPFVLACDDIADLTGSCPFDRYDHEFEWCSQHCGEFRLSFCWQCYFRDKAKEKERMNKKDFFRFPTIESYQDIFGVRRNIKLASEQDQLEKINEEATEFLTEKDPYFKVVECLDLIHACETWISNFVSEKELNRAYNSVIDKNDARRYYEVV